MLSASAPKLVVEVDETATAGTSQHIAPPGQDYITFVLHIASATSDRPASFVAYFGGGGLAEPLLLDVPAADRDAFATAQPALGYDALQVATGCTPSCNLENQEIRDQTYVSANAAAAIPVGGSVDLALYFNDPVPSTAPVGDITYHWVWPQGNDISVPLVAG